jgi:hypothetical protein
MLLASPELPPPPPPPPQQQQQQQSNAPLMNRKRSRSPIMMNSREQQFIPQQQTHIHQYFTHYSNNNSPMNNFRQMPSPIQQGIQAPVAPAPISMAASVSSSNSPSNHTTVSSVNPSIQQLTLSPSPINNNRSNSISPVQSNQQASTSNNNSSIIASFSLPNATGRTKMAPMIIPSSPSPPPGPSLPMIMQQAPPVPMTVPMSVYQTPPPLLPPMKKAPALPVIPPRPQLRLHFPKHVEFLDSPMFDDLKDPMKPDLDVTNLRRLTVATLRTLGVYLSFEELPVVDIEDPLPTDSQQVLPAAAMQLITTMVLGTSGDKDVSQTLGSQISNGDLVALQRMIVAGLRSKNIVIHTVLTEQPSIKNASFEDAPGEIKRSAATTDDMIDLAHVKYEPPHNVTRLFLRLYRYILNMLLSTPDCWPFIQPVPDTAFLYHQEIKNPMDLYTIEENVWHGKYTKFARFEKDMQLIWKNARVFHRNAGTIPKHADNLEKLFTKIVMDIKRQIRWVESRG